MSKKKKVAAVPAPRYVSREQQKAVKAIVTFLLNNAEEEGLDHISQATLKLAFDKYVDLVDAEEEPGATGWYRIGGDYE